MRATLDERAPDDAIPDGMRHRDLYPEQHPAAADRLLKARLAAGWRSGRAAAEAHGWPVGTYTGDEAGSRKVTAERAARYASAFAVPTDWLLHGTIGDGDGEADARALRLHNLHHLAVSDAFADAGRETPKPAAGRRLTQARRDAGLKSVRAAARLIGLPPSTCQKHENESSSLDERTLAPYAAAYGADLGWLVTERFEPTVRCPRPTGNAPADPEKVARLVEGLRRASPGASHALAGFLRVPRETLRVLLGDRVNGARGPFVVASLAEDARSGHDGFGSMIVIDAGDREGFGPYARRSAGRDVLIVHVAEGSVPPPDLLGRVLMRYDAV